MDQSKSNKIIGQDIFDAMELFKYAAMKSFEVEDYSIIPF